MAKPNYAFEKRQRDLAKKAKKEEKRQRKTGSPDKPEGADSPEPAAPPPATDESDRFLKCRGIGARSRLPSRNRPVSLGFSRKCQDQGE